MKTRPASTTRHCTIGLLLCAVSAVAPALAHGGGLNKQGCHNDRTQGGYHCHGIPTNTPRVPQRRGAVPSSRTKLTGSGTSDGGAYRNCSEARAAGAAPVRRGETGYGPHLDRDNDGIGCEPYRGR